MKFIYNNTKYEIIVDDFISIYHLIKLIEKKYKFLINDSYSITDLEGKNYKTNGTIIKNDDILVFKKKLIGGDDFNPNDTSVFSAQMNTMAFITAIISGFYYFKYISGIIVNNNISYEISQIYLNQEENKTEQMGGVKPNNSSIEMNELGPTSKIKQIKNILKIKNPTITTNSIQNNLAKYSININSIDPKNAAIQLQKKMNGEINDTSPQIQISSSPFKNFLNSFVDGLRDNKFQKVNCAFKKNFPDQELNRDYDNKSNWNMIATSGIFFTYLLTILLALFINPISNTYCGTPNGAMMIMTIIMLFIPLALVFCIQYIVKGLNLIIKGLNILSFNLFHLDVDVSKYKLTTSNIILIVMLIIYCAVINKKGISPMFGLMIPVFMLIFAVADFIMKQFGVFRKISRFFGNLITNTEKIPEDDERMFNSKDIRPSHKITSPDNKQAPECYYRFNIFHSLFYGIIASLLGCGFFTAVYSPNIKYCCP